MLPRMSRSPYITGSYAPIHTERDHVDLEVIGSLPEDLAGLYVRNGPNPQFEPVGRYHWFDGDGMLHAVRFEGGRASYSNRWIETKALAREREAERPLWRGLMESMRENPKDAPYKDTANTDVLFFGGELLGLWYFAGEPYRVDPDTLETLGVDDFSGTRKSKIAAHAKVDPETGELLFFEYGPRPPFMSFGVVSKDRTLAHQAPIDLPGPRFPHDMAITERYAILMDLPIHFDAQAMKDGRWATRFHRDLPARFGVIPRRGGSDDIRWFEAEPCYIYHTVNAWEEGDEIVMVACRTDDPIPDPDPADGEWARMMANLRVTARLCRWRFNLRDGSTKEEQIDDDNTEFPTMNERRLGRRSRYAYNVHLGKERTLSFDGLVKYDLETGGAQKHEFGPGRRGSEAPFAPRPGATAEDDGYVVSFLHDEREDRSEVVVLDARDFAAGPVARVLLPERVPLGFHACFVPGDALNEVGHG